jgi:hypothetical protein
MQVSGVVPAGAGETYWCGMLYVAVLFIVEALLLVWLAYRGVLLLVAGQRSGACRCR